MLHVQKRILNDRISLEHGSTVVVVNNKVELNKVLNWCKEKDKIIIDWFNKVEKFPLCISVASDIVGWTDKMDRALYYKPFEDFLKDIGE